MKRPPEISQLTAERRTKSNKLVYLLKKTRKYCGQASLEIEAGMHGRSPPDVGARHLRSQAKKELFGLAVPDCSQCDGHLIEALATCAKNVGREIASPTEAREILGI